VVSVGLVFLFEFLISFFLSIKFSDEFSVLIKAPITEELAKASLIFITVKSRNMDNLTDALVYGAAIGLGFGMTENALYFINNSSNIQSWISLVIIRSAFSGVMHGISTSIFAAFIMMARFNKISRRNYFYISGLMIAILIHFTWNYSAIHAETFNYGIYSILVGIAVFLATIKTSLRFELRILFEQLAEEIESVDEINLFYKKRKSFSNLTSNQIMLYIKIGFVKKKLLTATASESTVLNIYLNELRANLEQEN